MGRMQQRRAEAEIRRAFESVRAEERVACWGLVEAIVRQAIDDLRTARGSDLDTAVLYFTEPSGELVRWHADVLGLDVAAVRQRAQALLAERFGPDGAALWARLAQLAGGQKRRGCAA